MGGLEIQDVEQEMYINQNIVKQTYVDNKIDCDANRKVLDYKLPSREESMAFKAISFDGYGPSYANCEFHDNIYRERATKRLLTRAERKAKSIYFQEKSVEQISTPTRKSQTNNHLIAKRQVLTLLDEQFGCLSTSDLENATNSNECNMNSMEGEELYFFTSPSDDLSGLGDPRSSSNPSEID